MGIPEYPNDIGRARLADPGTSRPMRDRPCIAGARVQARGRRAAGDGGE